MNEIYGNDEEKGRDRELEINSACATRQSFRNSIAKQIINGKPDNGICYIWKYCSMNELTSICEHKIEHRQYARRRTERDQYEKIIIFLSQQISDFKTSCTWLMGEVSGAEQTKSNQISVVSEIAF